MLNKKGIKQLADDLVAHKKLYDQCTFGEVEDCGTVCCLAGFCYRREIGPGRFNKLVMRDALDADLCVNAGKVQLGLTPTKYRTPALFESIGGWPSDLETEYYRNGPLGRVVVALKALQRLKPNGSIDRRKAAVHTRLPQLRTLLKEQKAIQRASR